MDKQTLQKRIDKTLEHLEDKLGYKPGKLQHIELDSGGKPYVQIVDWNEAVKNYNGEWSLFYNDYKNSTKSEKLLEV